jgi:hypothetical protein
MLPARLVAGNTAALLASDFRTRAAVAVLGDLALTGVSLRAASTDRIVERVAAAMRRQRKPSGRPCPAWAGPAHNRLAGSPDGLMGAVTGQRRKATMSSTPAIDRPCRTPMWSARKPMDGGPARKAR